MKPLTTEQLKNELRQIIDERFAQMKKDPGYLAHDNVNRLNGQQSEWVASIDAATTPQQVCQVAYWWDAELGLEKYVWRLHARAKLLEYAELSMVKTVGEEYVAECEHQDGPEYWDVFDTEQQIYDDFVTYLTYAKMNSGEQ